MRLAYDAIPRWLIKGARKAGELKTTIVNKTPEVIADIKDAYKEGREETIPTQLDLFKDQPNKEKEHG